MTDHTKHNAKMGQEFWKKVEEGSGIQQLWNKLCVDGNPETMPDVSFGNFSISHYKFTWKPKIITIHGREVVAPMEEKPKEGSNYYFFNFDRLSIDFSWWENDSCDNTRFKLGIFDNVEDCQAFANAGGYKTAWQELVE